MLFLFQYSNVVFAQLSISKIFSKADEFLYQSHMGYRNSVVQNAYGGIMPSTCQ